MGPFLNDLAAVPTVMWDGSLHHALLAPAAAPIATPYGLAALIAGIALGGLLMLRYGRRG